MIPTMLVRAMFVLCICVLIIVAYARLTDRPLEAMPPSVQEVPIAQERLIRIYGSMDGSARVMDLDGTVIATLDETQGGFIAGVYRVLERNRAPMGMEGSDPIRLVRYSDGRLSLRDDFTDFRAELLGFGADNERAFARLLEE